MNIAVVLLVVGLAVVLFTVFVYRIALERQRLAQREAELEHERRMAEDERTHAVLYDLEHDDEIDRELDR